MSIGFSGTRQGMTPTQILELHEYLSDTVSQWIHLGDCIGADKECYDIAKQYGFKIFGHPPLNDIHRTFLEYDAEMKPRPYLVRNADIVKMSTTIVLAPKEDTEQLRSGTWSTFRLCKRLDKRWILILPDGTMEMSKG